MSKLRFGTKYRYNYKPGEHNCHVCKKGIKKGLQLHHHGLKKFKGGKQTKAIHDKCHAKSHGNYNHILTSEDRRKAGLKTYRQNLRNMPVTKDRISYKGATYGESETRISTGAIKKTVRVTSRA